MIARLTPDQITIKWLLYSKGIEKSLPPIVKGNDIRMNNILDALISGSMQLWGVLDDKDELMTMLCLTTITVDQGTFTRNLLIYAIYKMRDSSEDLFYEGLDILLIFAKENKCQFINAYTDQPHVVSLAKGLGANIDWTYLSFEVNG